MSSKSKNAGFLYHCLTAILCLFLGGAACAATTWYVSPSGSGLSTSSSSPGSLSYTVANATSGSLGANNIVILENGVYDGSPNGFTVNPSYVLFQAQTWHGAIVENTTASNLWGPGGSSTNVTCQGIVFGPSAGLGWSGGGGTAWEFLDCVFTQNGGVGAGSNSVFENDLFTDASSNAFDFADSNQSVIDCVVRRSNRSSADDDAVGNKEDFTSDFFVNGLVAYDNNCPAMWFDTSNDGWTVENSTFFANHGGNNWYYMGINSGSSTTTFNASGQDGAGFSVGQPILGLTGTEANIGAQTVVTAVSGSNITVSPALPAVPQYGDQFAAQQDSVSSGDGFITEANDNGTFTNNWVYSNTDNGYFDHSSGGTTYGGAGGLTIADNLFAYDGEGFFAWSDARDMGPASLQHNSFLFTPGSSSAFDSWGSTPGTYPIDAGIDFDYNDYDATNAQGNWAYWFSNPVVAGGLTAGSQPSGQEVVNGTEVYQDYLQNPLTWDQDLHSNTNSITFYGTPPTAYDWPAATDTNWSDVYFPNNTFGLSNSIHQIDDTNGAVDNTIDSVIDGKTANSIVTIPVSAHTPVVNNLCQVYDLNGRWVALTVPSSSQTAFLAAVPPYVTCTTGNATQTYSIKVTLNSVLPYDITATYNPSGGGSTPTNNPPAAPTGLSAVAGNGRVTLTWNASANATGYDIYRSTTSRKGYAKIGAATTTTYTDSSVTNGKTYYYVVTAIDSAGASGYSNQASATPAAPAPVRIPAAPTGLSAVAGNARVTLTWNASASATNYDVYRSTTSGRGYAKIGACTTPAYTDSSVTDGKTYYYVVTAVDSAGASGYSNVASATPTAPAAPVIASFPAGVNFISLPYDYSSISLSSVLGYNDPMLAVWSPTASSYILSPNSPADRIRLGVGYWVRFPKAVSVTLQGTPASTTGVAIDLSPGWNQIGDPYPSSVALSGVDVASDFNDDSYASAVSAGLIGAVVYRYDTGTNAYESVSDSGNLEPGNGYFIDAFASVTLQVGPP